MPRITLARVIIVFLLWMIFATGAYMVLLADANAV
jgi:hypothetical protein